MSAVSSAMWFTPSTNIPMAILLSMVCSFSTTSCVLSGWPHDKAHLPGRLGELHPGKSLHAAPVKCSAWVGRLLPGRGHPLRHSRIAPTRRSQFALLGERPCARQGAQQGGLVAAVFTVQSGLCLPLLFTARRDAHHTEIR